MGRVNKSRIRYGKISDIIQKLDKKFSIRVGILGNNATKKAGDSSLTMAELGAVHEFGATINHPGGTPYLIKEDGTAQFVSKDKGKKLPKTKPHEIVIPTRSFLRMPLLSSEGKKALQVWSVDEKEAFIEYLNKDTVSADVLAKTIGAKALERVLDAFKTDGFGNWKPTMAATRRRRKGSPSNPTLEDTGDLKDSITFEINEL